MLDSFPHCFHRAEKTLHQIGWVLGLSEQASWLMPWWKGSQLQVRLHSVFFFLYCKLWSIRSYLAVVISCVSVQYTLIAHSPLPPSSGVIATHRITASSPDTDLPTVSGLRVRRCVCVVSENGKCCCEHICGQEVVHACSCKTNFFFSAFFIFFFPISFCSSFAENGGEPDN